MAKKEDSLLGLLQAIGRQATGAGEAGATLASGLISSLVGMPYGVYKGVTSDKYGTPEGVRLAEREAADFIARNTYTPRTEEGQNMLGALGRAVDVSKVAPIGDMAMLAGIQGGANRAAAARLAEDFQKYNQQLAIPGASNVLPPSRFQGKPLQGLLDVVDMGGGRKELFGTDQRLVDIAQDVTQKHGVVYSPQLKYAELDVDRASRLAKAYDKMANNPADPAVKRAYDKMIEETMGQYEALRKKGYKFDFMPESGDIYGNPRNAINDLILNKHMSVFPTEQGFGGPSAAQALEANPLLMRTGEYWGGKPVTANDVFRAVHDAFGHAKHGVGFRARGEENAFQSHARMYSPEALPAVTSETRGQNSWVNYGPFGEFNRKASPVETEYAEQKTGIMPAWTWTEGLLK